MGLQRVDHNLATKQQQIPSGNVEAKQNENKGPAVIELKLANH